jgi:competence protein ComEC
LDHFNGVPALRERFALGRVSFTPSFAERDSAAVRHTLDMLKRHGIPTHVLRTGDRLVAGAVTLEVLHPPADGPGGNENTRSLVLLVRHRDHTLLLTGDLEGEGLMRLLQRPPFPVDVLQAPHHGSANADPVGLAKWARPRIVISCQTIPRATARTSEVYTAFGARYLSTWQHGAVTLCSSPQGLTVETFRTRQRWVIRPAAT